MEYNTLHNTWNNAERALIAHFFRKFDQKWWYVIYNDPM